MGGFTIIGFSAWAFFGHLITSDDDAPGGWSNPDCSLPFRGGDLSSGGSCSCHVGAMGAAMPRSSG